jgi:hypothetical protein
MEKREGYLEFVASENYKNQVEIWYKAYNITREKIDLFKDFILTLYDIIDETYLGSDVIFETIDQKNHFDWCWNKLLTNFEYEGILFKSTGGHKEYFWAFFEEAYYLNELEKKPNRIRDYYEKVFSFDYKKTRSELDLLTEIYKVLESNIKK